MEKGPELTPAQMAPLKAKSSRIALIGFYPFKRVLTGSTPGYQSVTYHYEIVLDYERSTASYLGFGRPVAEIPAKGVDAIVPSSRVAAFIGKYVEYVRRSGFKELDKMVVVEKHQFTGQTRYRLKKRPVDYYIMAVHGPPKEKNSAGSCFATEFGTGLLSAFSLGLLPSFSGRKVETRIIVFDAKLNLIKEYPYDGSVVAVGAFWAPWIWPRDDGLLRYRGFLRRFSDEFSRDIKGK